MARVESRGVEILEGVCEKSFYFREPDGNPIEASGCPKEAE